MRNSRATRSVRTAISAPTTPNWRKSGKPDGGTARLCAGETYYDCPYYEQMQYMGDTRIQCLISLYVSGDDRLMRRAINDIASSVTQEGILRSRYPTKVDQIIPSFSLYWINCLHDYWMHRDDPDFVRSYLPVLKSVLGWYERKIDPNTGMLGQMPYWNFLDWPKQWPWTTYEPPTGGVPPGGRSGGSSIMTLQLAYTLGDAVELLDHFGERALADKYRRIRDGLCSATMTRCFDSERNLLADDIARSSFSQHASIMGILSGAVGRERERQVFEALCADTTLTPATVYYQFYLVRAMIRAGLADRYAERLDTWRDMIAAGLTTFAEEPEPTRSDCHAWSASPNYYLLATVCGIVPASPGFGSVLVERTHGPARAGQRRGSAPERNDRSGFQEERRPDHGPDRPARRTRRNLPPRRPDPDASQRTERNPLTVRSHGHRRAIRPDFRRPKTQEALRAAIPVAAAGSSFARSRR